MNYRYVVITRFLGRTREGHVEFEYTALGEGEIRLLVLKPSILRIRSSLLHVSLANAPSFEAMSYTWGDPTRSSTLNIGGRWFGISKNVHGMLQDRVSLWRTRLFWIDSICINQEDISERNAQVQIMRDIYSKAWRTTIWLGSAPDAGLAHIFMGELVLRIIYQDTNAVDFSKVVTSNEDNPKWLALQRLLYHPY